MALRAHALLERRRDRYVLADHSTNGSYVNIDGDREMLLRREALLLHGHNYIAFGHSCTGVQELVEFFCE
jgi:adenylate cyclase